MLSSDASAAHARSALMGPQDLRRIPGMRVKPL
jgi:hypothetical protein